MTDRHKQKTEAIDNDLMKEQDKRMPINIDRQSRVTFGGTKKSNFLIISRVNPYHRYNK